MTQYTVAWTECAIYAFNITPTHASEWLCSPIGANATTILNKVITETSVSVCLLESFQMYLTRAANFPTNMVRSILKISTKQ